MRIKKLDIVGFKSFKDRTVIQFDAGITGIVGPNGCGKSNIVDALVWVMGEMSAKHLRGSSMEDVIFAGAEGYAPMGMAEVSLTLENDGGAFPAQYQRFSEISVTRRLHRNGESEYLVNREPARLRDIQEIFMDTGAGSKGFSIIEQGAIGKIVTSKPEDRRTLIEEAAGITKFKVRKRESQRKLESTDANLVRLQDIIGEQKRQLDSLERQAQRAERYRKLKTELQEKELWLNSKNYSQIFEELSAAETLFASSRDEEALHSGGLNELELLVQSLRLQTSENEMRVQDKAREYQELNNKVQSTESQIRELNFAIETARRSNEMTGSILSQYSMRQENLRNEKEKVEENLATAREESLSLESDYQTKNTEFTGIQNRVGEADRELTDRRREMLATTAAVTHLEAREQSMQSKVADENSRLASAQEMLSELTLKRGEFESRRNQLFRQLEAERQIQLDVVRDVETIADNVKTLRAQVEERRLDNERLKDDLNQTASRLYGLEDLQSNFEGFEDGVKNILLWQRSRGVAEGFRPLAEVVEVPQKYEMAMEAALGNRLQVLLSKEDSEAVEAIQHLKQGRIGRSSFAVSAGGRATRNSSASGDYGNTSDSFTSGAEVASQHSSQGGYSASSDGMQTVETTQLQPIRAEEGFDAFLSEVVAIRDDDRAMAQRFFQNVVVVQSLDQAIHLHRRYTGFTFVTLDGDTVTSDGIVTGGSTDSADSGVLRRRREIKELSLKREELAGKMQLSTLSVRKSEEQLEGVQEQLELAKKTSVEKEIRIAEMRKDLERAEMEFNNANGAVEKERREHDRLALSVQTINETMGAIQSELVDKRTAKLELDATVERLTQELADIRAGIDEKNRAVTDLRIKSSARRQEVEGLERQLLLVSTSLEDLESQLSQMNEESERNTTTLTSSQIAVEGLQSDLTRLIHTTKEAELAVSAERNKYETEQSETRAKEEELNSKHSRIHALRSTLNEAQLKTEQLRLRETYLVEQTMEKYQVSLRENASQYSAQEGDAIAIAAEVEELKDKVKRIGEVNLAAIQEYDDLIGRYNFLTQQHQDLIDAKEHLRKVIDRINRICSRRFKETFELVNERFTKVFPVLFGGGEARLVFIESPDGDDPGIDIISRPPGKKMQSVSLLSGGEKALTAVSLIFSIFLVKPSPFCLLDEVDAPLDDANVYRFNDLVREMAKRSQIIVVTHNKHTMKVNKKLYGVTMQEKGVSKMVSVSLEDALKTVAN